MAHKKTAHKKTAKRKTSAHKKTAAEKAKRTRERNFNKRVKREPYENRDKMRAFNRRKQDLKREIWG